MHRALAAPLAIAIAILLAGCSVGTRGDAGGLDVPGQGSSSASSALGSNAPATVAPSPVASAPATTAGPTPAPTKVPGTGKITLSSYAFAITLPAGWRQVPLDGSDTSDIEAALPAGSQMAAALQTDAATAAAKGFALLAMDLSPDAVAAGTVSTLEVQAAAPQDLPLSLLESLATGLLEQAAGVTSVSSKIVTLPAGKAIRITYTLTLTTSSGQQVKLAATDYVLESPKHTYTTTVACSSAIATTCRSTADATMKTFVLL